MSNLLIEQVKAKLQAGEKESHVRRFVRNELGLGKSQGNARYNQIVASLSSPQVDREVKKTESKNVTFVGEKEKIKNLEFDKGYYFNKEDKTYVVFLKSAARAILVDEETHNNMLRAYTSKDEPRVEDICAALNFPISLFDEYRRIFLWRRNSSILTDEMLESKSVDELAEDSFQQKKWETIQEIKKRQWASTETNSKKWLEFENNCLVPFDNLLFKWTPPPYVPVPDVKITNKEKSPHSLLVNCGDWHVGAIARPRYLYRSKEWNYEILCESAKEYSDKIRSEVNSRTYNIEEIVYAWGAT